MSALTICLLPIVSFTFLVFIITRIVFRSGPNRIQMDGAVCVIKDSQVTIKPRYLYNILALGFMVFFLIVILLSLVYLTYQTVIGEWTILESLETGIFLAGIGVILYFALRQARARMNTRTLIFDEKSRILTIRNNNSVQEIPFKQIKTISQGKSHYIKTSRYQRHPGRIIPITLTAGSNIIIGKVSGNSSQKAEARAQNIMKILSQITGAKVQTKTKPQDPAMNRFNRYGQQGNFQNR